MIKGKRICKIGISFFILLVLVGCSNLSVLKPDTNQAPIEISSDSSESTDTLVSPSKNHVETTETIKNPTEPTEASFENQLNALIPEAFTLHAYNMGYKMMDTYINSNTIDQNNFNFYKVENMSYDSFDKWENYLKQYLSGNALQSILQSKNLINHEGELYAREFSCDIRTHYEDFTITSVVQNTDTATIILSVPTDFADELEEWELSLEHTDRWRISDSIVRYRSESNNPTADPTIPNYRDVMDKLVKNNARIFYIYSIDSLNYNLDNPITKFGKTYYIVEDQFIKSFQELKELVSTTRTELYASQMFAEDGKYIDVNGTMYTTGGESGSLMDYSHYKVLSFSRSENLATLVVQFMSAAEWKDIETWTIQLEFNDRWRVSKSSVEFQ